MQTLESMRKRIQGAEDLYAVVRVMKALAAVSIRQYERAVDSLEQYGQTIEQGLQIVLRNRPDEILLNPPATQDRWAAVIFGSDQGMCGSFNDQVATLAQTHLDAKCTILVVGTRVATRLEDAGRAIDAVFPVPGSVAGITPIVHDLVTKVEELRVERGIEHFFLFYNRSISGAVVRAQRLPLLPVDPDWLRGLQQKRWPSRSLPLFTMNWRLLFSSLIRQHLFVTLYRAFAESLANENASRLASMQAAERNIQEHLTELSTFYHESRHQSITDELLDIVAGFEMLTTTELKEESRRKNK